MGRILQNLAILVLALLVAPVAASAQAVEPPDPSQNATTPQPPPAPDAPKPPAALPHVRFDREKHFVEFDATIVTRESDWLELFVCTAGTRDYESILTTPAKPSHIHLALLAIDVKPGSPISWERRDDKLISHPATGDAVTVSVVMRENDKEREIPAGDWIIHGETKAAMEDSRWIFTGSRFKDVRGQSVYLADVEGNVLSLVNFGDDLLVRPSAMEGGQGHGNPDWVPNTDVLPPRGTNVVVRLRPIEKNDDADAHPHVDADEDAPPAKNKSENVDGSPSPR